MSVKTKKGKRDTYSSRFPLAPAGHSTAQTMGSPPRRNRVKVSPRLVPWALIKERQMEALLIIWLSGIAPVSRGIYLSGGRNIDMISAVIAAVPWPVYLLRINRFAMILAGKCSQVAALNRGLKTR